MIKILIKNIIDEINLRMIKREWLKMVKKRISKLKGDVEENI